MNQIVQGVIIAVGVGLSLITLQGAINGFRGYDRNSSQGFGDTVRGLCSRDRLLVKKDADNVKDIDIFKTIAKIPDTFGRTIGIGAGYIVYGHDGGSTSK